MTKLRFGSRVRELRIGKSMTQPMLAQRMGVSVSYISKVENEKLIAGDYPSAKFIHKLAAELDADEDELLLLSDRIPRKMRQRIRENPDAFKAFAALSDVAMDRVLGRRNPRTTK